VFFASQERRHHIAGVVGAVIEVNDLDSVLKTEAAHILQAAGPINEEDGFFGLAQAAPDGFLAQERTNSTLLSR
jgi:hypothetical protein